MLQALEASRANAARPERVQEIDCGKPPALCQSATIKPLAPSRGFPTGYSPVRLRCNNEAIGNFQTG
ncbi:MAG: hypothetical protein HY231_16940 [Acidobacteria bacterium]|nr:hypothetical protein [Acidobacteriota bacterium]